jgi:hypothetical protein
MDKVSKEIIIVTAGGTKHLKEFSKVAKLLNIKVETASFSDMGYIADDNNIEFTIKGRKIEDFSLCYIRLAGKRYEDLAILVNELRRNKIKIVDQIYDKSAIIRLPLPKSIEAISLIEKGLPVPNTLFGNLKLISEKAPEIFGYPFVIKVIGKQGHAVWSPNKEDLNLLIKNSVEREKREKDLLLRNL